VNILFLHSGLTVTGSVTYAAALEHAWGSTHRVFWANDGLKFSNLNQQLTLPLRKKLFPHGISNAFQVARYVRANSIQMMHAHSRRANMVAAMASRLTGVPYVTTAHMRTGAHYGNRLWPCWGRDTIAICETIADHLQRENRVPAEQIRLIRNGINLDVFKPVESHPTSGVRWITVPGRLSGLRWNAAAFIFSQLEGVLEAYPDVRVRFVGWIDPEHQGKVDSYLQNLNSKTSEPRVIATGHLDDTRLLMAESTVIVGAGRSLMEAMAMGLPVVNIGEGSNHGLMTQETFPEAQKSNFGDFPYPGKSGFDPVRFRQGIDQVLQGRIDRPLLGSWGRERIMEEYNVLKVARQINDVYTDKI
jgi:glycosyltransferase involved in cell wall biosynthesis